MKKCPFCAEEIQDEAIKCKHCGELLNVPKSVTPQEPPQAPAQTPAAALAKTQAHPVAGLFSFAGAWAMLYGLSKWFGGHETQTSMAAGGAGDFSKPITDQAMSSGLTYAGIGLMLFIFAGLIQVAAKQEQTGPHVVPGTTSSLNAHVNVPPAVAAIFWIGLFGFIFWMMTIVQ